MRILAEASPDKVRKQRFTCTCSEVWGLRRRGSARGRIGMKVGACQFRKGANEQERLPRPDWERKRPLWNVDDSRGADYVSLAQIGQTS